MNLFEVGQAARAVGGRTEGQGTHAPVTGVTIDSREVAEGSLFVALPGTKSDGHAFVVPALEAGAAAAIVSDDAAPLPPHLAGKALIRTSEPRRALAELAAWHRVHLSCPVVAITGSNGKSSTREMTAAVLAPLGDVVQSLKSYNNDLGLPLTILRADTSTAALVVEMGTSSRGEIARLVQIARPTVGIVTNVGAAHLAGLGSEDAVAEEKGALPRGLAPGGFAILNADDRRVAAMAERTPAHVLTTSLGDWHATVWGCDARRTPRGVEFFLYGKGRMFLPVPGIHNARNALLAVAAGLVHGITAEQMRDAFRRVRLPALRLQRMTIRGVTFVLDCYNANPASMEAAVEELAARPVPSSARAAAGRRILLMGDMLELGPRASEFHYAIGRIAARKVDALWCVGPESRYAYEAALDAGMDSSCALWFQSVEAAEASPAMTLSRGDIVMMKASRGMRIERLAEPLSRTIAESREGAAKSSSPASGAEAATVG